MYCPYLRGKQFELLALREFSSACPGNEKIVPIIEPVKQQLSGLNMAVGAMLKNRMKFAVVLNPQDGDFKHISDNDVLKELLELNRKNGAWIPAYIYGNKGMDVLKHAEDNGLEQIMVVFPNVDTNNESQMAFISNERVKYVVAGNLRMSRTTKKILKGLSKEVISLEDCFESKVRNADYADNPDELFSEDFAFYKEDGLYGFSDYTPMAKEYAEGGMLPYAIAIHLTYQKSDSQIFVHHFVSDNNFDQSNIRGKFHEAAVKIAPFYEAGGYPQTPAVEELISKAQSSDGYPGLGYIKKLSIKNHLELINRILPE